MMLGGVFERCFIYCYSAVVVGVEGFGFALRKIWVND